ncbi:XdhC family protein [Rhodococcus sp. NPDC127528]|uniref:XdhC family protein n=1 Tax=unclassified Rhodococcus (in: high G+C Gram-positive bacteria) TaxID=192944 RepID=UPI0036346292
MQMNARIAELTERRQPFVHATVVRAQAPTSARAGDEAIVLPDGTIEGFVGGQCARNSVRVAALGALRSEESVLLRVLPDGAPEFPDAPGAAVVVNPCLSGGAMEIFLEPRLPAPVVRVVGATPVADAVAELARFLDFAVRRDGDDGSEDPVAVIVASLGEEEPRALRAALDAGAGYVGLVASRVRGAAVIDQLEPTAAERALVHTPVGLPIGARTPAEIAVSVMAEVVRARRVERLGVVPAAAPATDRTTDPVCGMEVAVGPDTPHLTVEGRDYWFCGPGCLRAYEKERARCS